MLSGTWFEPVSSEGQYESDFESMIVSRGEWLFPQFHVVPFRMAIESEEGRKIPDLALVDLTYRFWWVVEVEMAHHSLSSHVIPQVEVFTRGRYGEEHANYLAGKRDDLDGEALQDMIMGAQPRVVVVVNRSVPDWMDPIHGLDAIVTVVEIFRSDKNEHILRVNGDYPGTENTHIASLCRLDTALPGLLQVDSPAGLGIATGGEMSMEFNGGLTRWSRLDVSDRVWLVPAGRNPLVANQEYEIIREPDSRLTLRQRS